MKRKSVSVPLRLEGDTLRAMQGLARLTGYSVSTVTSVCVGLGFIMRAHEIAARLVDVRKVQKKWTPRRQRRARSK
jgi:hypothetical protein